MLKHSRHTLTIVILCLALVISVFIAKPLIKTRAVGTPQDTLSPTSGPPGSVFTITGTGFTPNDSVSIYFDTTLLTTLTASTTGTFSLNLSVPLLAQPGNHTVQASGQNSWPPTQATFLVRTNWAMYGSGPEHRGVNASENVLTPANVSGLAQDWIYTTEGDIYTSPAVVNGILYVGSNDGKLYALEAATGAYMWSYTTQGAINSSPAVVNGIVYVGSDDHKMYALNAMTGKRKWSYTTGGAVDSSPTLINGVVYFGSADYKLYALDALTGTLKWSYTTGSAIITTPAVANGMVYIGSDKVYALDAVTGALKWSYAIGKPIITSPAVSATGLIYIGSDKMYALNSTKGTLKWSYTPGSGCAIDSMPAVLNNVVYFGTNGGRYDGCAANIFAVNATTGATVWSTFVGEEYSIKSTPVLANGLVYINSNDFDHTLTPSFFTDWFALDATNGNLLWGHKDSNSPSDGMPNSVPPSPVVVNGVFYIGSIVGDHDLYALHVPGTTLKV